MSLTHWFPVIGSSAEPARPDTVGADFTLAISARQERTTQQRHKVGEDEKKTDTEIRKHAKLKVATLRLFPGHSEVGGD